MKALIAATILGVAVAGSAQAASVVIETDTGHHYHHYHHYRPHEVVVVPAHRHHWHRYHEREVVVEPSHRHHWRHHEAMRSSDTVVVRSDHRRHHGDYDD